MKLFTSRLPLAAALLLSSVALTAANDGQLNLTASESSSINNIHQKYLRGNKENEHTPTATNADDNYNKLWAERVLAAAAFEESYAEQKYRAANGCPKNDEKQTDICLASEHSSNAAVHCCKGSMKKDDLKCSRNGCNTRSTFAAAKLFCEDQGMRLCSVAELESGACCDEACSWDKKISWTSDSCDTGNPTSTMTPTSASAGTLVTMDSDRTTDYKSTLGLMFEVEAREDVSITSLSFFTGSNSKTWTDVYMRYGSYKGNTASSYGWEKIYSGKSQQRGTEALTEVKLKAPVNIEQGATVSFYIVSPGLIISVDSIVKEGKAIAQNEAIKLYSGAALAYGLWEEGCMNGWQCVFSRRSFEGTISYNAVTITSPPTDPENQVVQSSGALVTIDSDRTTDYESTLGLMFEVEAREDVSITSLSFFTGSNSKTWTDVYMRYGSYKGNTASSYGWEKIYSGKSQQRGTEALTEVKLKTPVYIEQGETTSFYIVSPGLIISVDSIVKEGKAIAQNDAIKLYSGAAIAYGLWEEGCMNGWQCVFSRRSFEGTISYNAVTITSPPTGLENEVVESPGTLVTIDSDMTTDYKSTLGLMFEVEAREDVSITSLSFFTGSNSKTWTDVYMRYGSYKGNTASSYGWEKIYSGKSQQRGTEALTEVKLKTPVYIELGATVSFYIVSPGMIISVDSGVKEGKAIAQNDAIKLYSGAAIAYGLWEEGCMNGWQCVFPRRSFEGTIGYNVVTFLPPAAP